MECALKACICLAGLEVPRTHSLVSLYEIAEPHGFQLSDFELSVLIHLESVYFSDIQTGTKFMARYPVFESFGRGVPADMTLQRIATKLCESVLRRTDSVSSEPE